MKIKTVIISLLIVALMITSFLCVNANASSDTFDLPHSEHDIIDYTDSLSKSHFVFNYHKNYWVINPEFFVENYFEYFVIYNNNVHNKNTNAMVGYTLCFLGTSEDISENGQIQIYNSYYYFENMLCIDFSSIKDLIQFFNDPTNNLNLVKKFYTSSTYPAKAPQAKTLDNILYSSSDYVITQTYLEKESSDTGYKTQTMEESKWVYLTANPLQYTGVIPEEEPDDDKGILETLKDILKEIKDKLHLNPLNPGTIIFENASALINEKLSNNSFYVSIMKIKVELEDLLNEDYTSRTGFYELDLPINNFSLGKVQGKKYINVGNEVIGKWEQEFETDIGDGTIDWGLENVNLLNFDWFFGKDLGGGYYKKGVKEYSDMVIGSFLWLVFAYWLWHNLPDLIMGEIGTVGSMVASEYSSIVAEDERIEWNNQREAQREARIAEKEYRKSYDYYKENRARKEEYSARYYQEKKGAKKK